MAHSPDIRRPGSSRFWLYAPFVVLALIAAGWTAAWFVIRDQARDRLDAWLAREASAGRHWTCADRAVGGFPFRIEVTCTSVTLQHGGVTASFGGVHAVAQIYQPRHVIMEIEGPLRWSDGQVTAEAEWNQLETSIRYGVDGLQRASVVAEAPRLRVSGFGPAELGLSSQNLETHLRPSPGQAPGSGAYDLSINARQASVPGLEAWLGSPEEADLRLDMTVTQARRWAGRPILEEIERWREAKGQLDVALLSVSQGPRRAEARGELALDELHRPTGRLELAVAGLDGLLGALGAGRSGGADALLGMLLGGARPEPPAASPSGLSRLPPVRLEGGRVFLGPFPLPGLRLTPLY